MVEERLTVGIPVQVKTTDGTWRDGQVDAISRFGGHVGVTLADGDGYVTAPAGQVRRP